MYNISNSSSSVNKLKSFNNEQLVKYIDKIGHHEAARIIQEKKIDGQKILELTEIETLGWKLTNFQRKLLWNCISQIKAITYLDNDRRNYPKKLLNSDIICINGSGPLPNVRKKYKVEDNNIEPVPLPQYKKKYYKLVHKKQESVGTSKYTLEERNTNSIHFAQILDKFNSNKHVKLKNLNKYGNGSRESFYYSCSSINTEVFDSHRENYYTDSDYIYAPCIQEKKDDFTVNRIKKYFKSKPRRHSHDDVHELLSYDDLYLEVRDSQTYDSIAWSGERSQEINIYEEPPKTETLNLQFPKEATKKSPAHCIINICCFSCYLGCSKK